MDKGKVTKEAECTRAGEKEYTCETCGAKKTEEIAAKGHEWSSEYTVDKKATCTEKGKEVFIVKFVEQSKKEVKRKSLQQAISGQRKSNERSRVYKSRRKRIYL